jgi:hypothetical protein
MNKNFLYAGIGIMLTVAWLIFFWPDITGQQWFALVVIFIIGLGLTVAGSPDPNKKDEPGVHRAFGIDDPDKKGWGE